MKTTLAVMFAILILPVASAAYEIILDIDTDDDPTTINERTGASSAVVRLILQPTEANEWITEIIFGLGGTCWPCDYIEPGWAIYGTDWDLYWTGGTLPEFPLLSGYGPTCTLSIYCQGDPGFSCWWDAWAAGFYLTSPVFIGSFTASVADQDHPGCPLPPADLMAFANWSPDPGNAILLADPELAVAGPPIRAAIQLHQNHPNPFNPATTIGFALTGDAPVVLTIYDASGRTVFRRDLGWLPSGYQETQWRGTNAAGRAVPSGMYFYRVSAGELAKTRRMILLR